MAPGSHQPGPGPKSSLLSHSFPSFYACYLLKSIQTPLSKATYIGSTPNPPRRIRQHNGEITAGAWKTKNKRPWVMQMIVHGFPSRLAALQFEWAWQHPHLSRHLRDDSGKALFINDRKSKYLKTNIQIVRMMISNHPYITWPLHVTLFTEEAVNGWEDAAKTVGALPLPRGFTSSIELEGVDGRSGKIGSGRKGPIKVKDESFTSGYLAKNTAFLASNPRLNCSICHEPLVNYAAEALSTALCPTPTCTAVSHLSCLAHHFIKAQPTDTGLVPRGGTCTSCNTYTLWGDIIRGCYRRSTGGSVPEDDEIPEAGGAISGSDEEHQAILSPTSSPHKRPSKRKPERALPAIKKPRQRKAVAVGHMSSEGELFDLDVSSTDEGSSTGLLSSKKPGRPRKVVLPKPPQRALLGGDILPDLSPPKKHTRPRKVPAPQVPKAGPSTDKTPVRKAKKLNQTPGKQRAKLNHLQDSDASGEFFDFGELSEVTTSDDDDGPTRRRGMANRAALAPSNNSPLKRGLASQPRVAPNSPQNMRTAPPQALSSSHLDPHQRRATSKSPIKPFPQLEPLESLGNSWNINTDSDEILPQAEDVLTRALSSLSVSSPAPSPRPGGKRDDSMDVIEISD